ncbi:Protein ultraspiracle [Aphelenchoides besseyi]|nr:Protein ultraspiracle [Aphelenchoides besseyi]KAI6200325.1 Protein ultraspiracle [Aphelenchoides besseyi]
MASGARPCSNQRSESASPAKKNRSGDHEHQSCAVCGDRACSHHYYGTASCHGCKCFFWRSIKHNLVYVCRYQQNCDINPSHRNGCRYCRLQRCLKAGMQPESVRLQTPKVEGSDSPKFTTTATKRPATSTTVIGNSPLDSNGGPRSSESDHSQQADDESPMFKQARYDHAELVVKLSELSERIDQLADFNENNHMPKPQTLNLLTIFEHPEFLECYRTRVNFCVRLHSATFAKYRTLVKCFDYLHGLQNIGLTDMPFEDKVKILTGTYAPLTVFEMCFGTTKATKDANLLCLPTSITLSRNENIPQNGFLSQKLVNNMVSTLTRTIENLELTETEVLLLKAIIMLNQEVHGLTSTTANAVAKLRDRLHGALYQNCMSSDESPTIRFAKLLHILPKLTLLARELVEHIRAVQTFNSSIVSPLFFEMFGDIFEEERELGGLAKPTQSGLMSRCDPVPTKSS